MADKPFYEDMKLRKANGEQLNFEEITYEELYTLWWKEKVSDTAIGALYSISKRTVYNKRYKLYITRDEMFAKEALEMIFNLNDKKQEI